LNAVWKLAGVSLPQKTGAASRNACLSKDARTTSGHRGEVGIDETHGFRCLIEEEEPSDLLWALDLHQKKRIRGKTCYYFKRIETQEELDAMLQADYEAWVQYMKDAGSWQEE
jgi:hypothetical protein